MQSKASSNWAPRCRDSFEELGRRSKIGRGSTRCRSARCTACCRSGSGTGDSPGQCAPAARSPRSSRRPHSPSPSPNPVEPRAGAYQPYPHRPNRPPGARPDRTNRRSRSASVTTPSRTLPRVDHGNPGKAAFRQKLDDGAHGRLQQNRGNAGGHEVTDEHGTFPRSVALGRLCPFRSRASRSRHGGHLSRRRPSPA